MANKCAGRGCGRHVKVEGEFCSRACLTGGATVKREVKPVSKLVALEAIIERGLTEGSRLFAEAGKALREVQEQKLYRAEYGTFAEYCQARWSRTASAAYRQIQKSEMEEMLPMGDKQLTERQARELVPVFKAEGAEAVREVMEEVGSKATAAKIRRAVKERQQPPLTATYEIEQPCGHYYVCSKCGNVQP